jgi:hypothetical protein
MITSHAAANSHLQMEPRVGGPTETSLDTSKLESELKLAMSDPFNDAIAPPGDSPAAFEDDFEIPPINLPPSALEEQVPGHQGGLIPAGYNNGGHYQHYQQQQMYQQQQQQQQPYQQQWVNNSYMNNGYQQGQYSEQQQYNGYGYMYQQPQQQQQHSHVVAGGGPSPGGSHNTPSPQAHSEDGELTGVAQVQGDPHLRNNNVLKRPADSGVVTPGHTASGHPYMQPGNAAHYGHTPHQHHYGHTHIPHPHHHHHHVHQSVMPKKPKVSKRKKKRDPDEPQKPVSAYALFFRDSQASIKQANPNAAFGDVSKIVASMWDSLDPDAKAAYKKRTENAKKEYLKKLAAYRASLVSRGAGDTIGYGYPAFGPYDGMMGNKSPAAFLPGSSPGSNCMGQPIPPRPPMQQGPPVVAPGHHMHHQHGSYMMHGQVII